jgi:hypothetical protein
MKKTKTKTKATPTLDERIDTFLKDGGKIELIPSGVSGQRDGGIQHLVIAPPTDPSRSKRIEK